MEAASAVVGETTKSTIFHVEREINYLVHFRRNIKNLKIKLEQLTAMRNDIQRLADAALNNNYLISEAVETWLERVEAVSNEAIQVTCEAEKIKSWFKGWLTFSRFVLARKAEKILGVIQCLFDERSAFSATISDPKPTQNLELMGTTDFEAFASRKTITMRVINALENDRISLFGIFGMAGVGKTTLVKSISKHVKTENLFDEIVMVTVSVNSDIKAIQSDIANELDLQLEKEESVSLRAKRLSARLKRAKTILIILDDLWERVDLGEVGIFHGEENKACKVLITTRDQDVCNSMETQLKIEVDVLSEQDSWHLFRDKVGDVEDSTLEEVGRDIVSECKGLPLAIVSLARALREKEKIIWIDALQQLKKSIFEGMTPVVSSIRLSYNLLPNETIKMCFLFCSLFREDCKIPMSTLRSYVMGEKLLKGITTLEEASGRLYAIMDKLTSSCLLLKSDKRRVMMHDVVRDVAILIASEESNGFIIKPGMQLAEWSDMELYKFKRMSLLRNIRCDLPNLINGPQLLTLSLSGNENIYEIPPNLFLEMKSLLTLDLSRTRIKTLPPSLSCLVNLRALLLIDCWSLLNVSPVENLKRLEVLDLHGSKIQSLPEEMRSLTSLRMLNLSETHKLEIMYPKVLSSLVRLEELHMHNSFEEWELEGAGNGMNATLSEIASLGHLTSLAFCVANSKLLSQEIPNNWNTLKKYAILLGTTNSFASVEFYSASTNFERSMFIEMPLILVANWVMVLLDRTNLLYLNICEGIQSVGVIDSAGLNNCKVLHITNCADMKCLISSTGLETTPNYAFGNLEELALCKLDTFLAIFQGKLPKGFLQKLRILTVYDCSEVISLLPCDLVARLQNLQVLTVHYCMGLKVLTEYSSLTSTEGRMFKMPASPNFPNLRRLNISNCEKLKSLFSLRLARDLVQLEEVYIFNCTSMLMIVEADENVEDCDTKQDLAILPRLKSLILTRLPRLSSFASHGSVLVDCSSLEELRVIECDNLHQFSFAGQSLPKLKMLDVHSKWLNQLQGLDESLKSFLKTFLPGMFLDCCFLITIIIFHFRYKLFAM
ncbi:hypothetical protein ACHQM5_017620 [Ranunculus cassubicifolius]